MKRLILAIIMYISCQTIMAQIPYFSGTVGNGRLYGYSSVKFRPGINAQETYTTFQYGIGDEFATGLDLYTGVGSSYWGAILRYGHKFSPYFGIGAQITPSFDLNDNFKYSYTTAALYLNGSISKDGKLFWCSNTWWGINKDADNTITNWEYIGYTFSQKKGSITPMIGLAHDWKFDDDPDLLAGVYYSIGKCNFYFWGNDFFKDNPRIVVGVDFNLSAK